MDDIYADLENYNDFNTIEELRTENKQLKCKLEEYAVLMDNLKKHILQDYDKLTSEYKHLERNYSSLLKTARAEIERKTSLITQLNKEKDTMILNSIQNRNKNLLNISRNMSRYTSTKHDKTMHTKNRKNDNKNLKNKIEATNTEQEKQSSERKEENNTNSEDTVLNRNTDSNIENRFVEEYVQKFSESHRYNKRDTKEKKEQGNRLYKDDTSTADTVCKKSTMNRRKSVSDMRYSRFNSDECVDKYVPEANTWDLPLRNTTHVNEFVERKNDDRESNKISETSSVDDKYSNYYYHEAREEDSYKNKRRQYEIDKHKHKDKYESHSRYRTPGSSERFHPRTHHSHYDEQQFRTEYDKYRIDNTLFDRNHYQRRSHERRSNYERDYSYDYERHRHDSYPMKHKIQNDYEGPQNKRKRTNSYNKYADEDKISYRESEFVDEIEMPTSMKNIQYTTCQSPDYTPMDSGFSKPVIEIRHTAVTYLEDPRVTSKKYTIKTENDKTFLSTIRARNVDMKVINKSVWQMEIVKVPEPLLHHPSKYSQQMIDDIYFDVDNPTTNMSVESGELIDFDTHNSYCTTHHETERQENILKIQETENIRNSTTIETNVHYNNYQSNENNADSQLNEPDLIDVIESNQNYGNVNKQTNDKETKDIEKIIKESTTNEVGFTTSLSNYKTLKLKNLDKHSPHLLNTTDVGLCETEDQSDENANNQSNIKGQDVSEIENERNISSNGSCIDDVGKSLETLQKKSENGNKSFEENIDKDKLSYINTLTFNNGDRKPVHPLSDISSNESCVDYVGKSLETLQKKPENYNKSFKENIDKDKLSTFNNGEHKLVDPLSNHAVENNDIGNVEFESKNKKSLGGLVEEDLELSNETIDHEDLQKQKKKSAEETPESDKKHTIKKKANTKQNEISSKNPSETRLEDAINIKSKAKKEPTEIKTKFSALFGDTSSLITPEDLGIPISQTQNPTSAIYGPVYEDAQNAVDFDMKEIIEVKMRSLTCTAENILIQEKLTVSESTSKINETKEEPTLETINITKDNTERRTRSKKIDCAQNTVDLDMKKISKSQMRSSKLGIENRFIEEKQIISHTISENYGTEEKAPKTTINIPKVSTERRRKCKKSERAQNALDYNIIKTNESQMPLKPSTEIEEKQTVPHNIPDNDEIIEKPPMTITNIAKVSTERRRKSKKNEETENVDVNMKETKKIKMRLLKSVDNVLIKDKQTVTHNISENNETEEKQPLTTNNIAKINIQRRKSKKSEAQNVNEDAEEMNKGQMQSTKYTAENILIEEKQTVSHNISESNEIDKKQSMTTTNIANTEIRNSKISEGPTLATATVTSETANDYKYLNSKLALTTESGVHKTVIISTGIQNRYTSDNILEPAPKIDANVNQEQDFISNSGTSIIALATSTPYKTVETLQNEIGSQALDFSSVSNEGKIKKDIPAVTKVPTSDISDSRPNADEPDFKVFVKRRKKVIRKSPDND